jgi:hypothetical protein
MRRSAVLNYIFESDFNGLKVTHRTSCENE